MNSGRHRHARPTARQPDQSRAAGLASSFTNTPGATFTVYAATSLTAPVTWDANRFARPKLPNGGASIYTFTDTQTAGNAQRYYKVTSP